MHYRAVENETGVKFYIPKQEASANVPHSFEIFASSINKAELYDGEGVYLHLSGVDAEGNVDVMTGDLEMGNQNIVNANDVGATTVTVSTDATVSGQATMGSAVVENDVNAEVENKAVRNIIHSLNEPTSSDGNNGDIWFTYKDE